MSSSYKKNKKNKWGHVWWTGCFANAIMGQIKKAAFDWSYTYNLNDVFQFHCLSQHIAVVVEVTD